MRQFGASHLHVFCAYGECTNSIVIDADCWPARQRVSDLELMFLCPVCAHRGADVRQPSEPPD
jgi:hypothetical protein